MNNTIAQTLAALQNAKLSPDELVKATTTGMLQSTGLVGYDLSAPAKTLYPVLTPLRNRIPRVSGNGDTATRWKAVTAINPSKIMMGVGEAARSGFIDQTVQDYVAAYKGLGLENFITFESEYAGVGFDNVRARASTALLQSVMIGEENILFGANTSLALGTTPTPTLSRQATPASTASLAATLNVRCIALTHEGYRRSSVAGGVPTVISRNPGDGSAAVNINGGAAQISAQAQITTVGAAESVFATVTPVRGAVAYAWYWGAAASEVLGAITTVNCCMILAPATGTQNISVHTAGAADRSQDALVHDGLVTQIFDPAGGGYWKSMATGTVAQYNVANTGTLGFPLTADGSGGIKEIDEALLYFWENLRLSPDTLYVNAQELTNMTKALVKAGTNSAFRLVVNQGGEPGAGALTLTAGTIIGSYLNKYTLGGGETLKVVLHPTIPPGMILFYSSGPPYPLSGIDNVLQVKTRRDYHQIDWPLRTRRYEFGIYTDQLLQNFFPPSFGLITGIANGLA